MGRVLIVDDEKSIRLTLREFLRNDGFVVECAANTKEAYDNISKNSYDIIVTDIIMPGESGIEMLRKYEKILTMSKFFMN
jgi:DNA-binding response OmpR family regulator